MTCRDFGMKQIKLVDVRKLDAFLEILEDHFSRLDDEPTPIPVSSELELRFYEVRKIVKGLLK